jgi:hypothetical protein
VDGEIAALENEVTSFARLQRRMQVQEPSAELRRRVPVWFWAFDLPYFEDRDLHRVPLRQRKQSFTMGSIFTSRCGTRDGPPLGLRRCGDASLSRKPGLY